VEKLRNVNSHADTWQYVRSSTTFRIPKPICRMSRESSRVWTFCSRRRTRCTVTTAPDDGTRHPQLQPVLSSAGTCVLSWRWSEESDSSGNRRAVGSRFQPGPGAIRSKAALHRRRLFFFFFLGQRTNSLFPLPPIPSPSLEVGPLNTARGSGGAL